MQVDEDGEEYYEPPTSGTKFMRQKTCVPGHLATPIYDNEVDFLLNYNDRACKRHYKLKQFATAGSYLTNLCKTSDDPLRCVTNWISTNPIEVNRKQMQWDLNVSVESWYYQKCSFVEPAIRGDLISVEKIRDHCEKIKEHVLTRLPELERDFVLMKKAEHIKDKVCFREMDLGKTISYNNLHVERDLFFFQCCHGKVIGPTSLLLCALDKAQSIYPLKLYWLLCDAFKRYPGKSIFDVGNRLISLITPLRAQLGQDFFTFIGSYEALIVGYVVALSDDVGFKDLFSLQASEMGEILEAHNVDFDLDLILPPTTDDLTIRMFLELTGISKIFGYPTLIAENLLDQLKEYGRCEQHEIDLLTVKHITGIAYRDLIINYYNKHKVHLKLVSYPPKLKCMQKNQRIPANILKDYDLWSSIAFVKQFEYDFTPDTSELIKDSSAAYPMSHWGSMYDKCAFKYLYGKHPPPSFRRDRPSIRVIDSFLQGDEDQVRKLINEKERGVYDENHHIAVLCGKETELKTKSGRAFTKQTPDQRLIQTSMEKNISDSIFKYVPEQSMNDSEIVELLRVMEDVSKLQGESEIVVTDFKKWNIFQTYMTNALLGRMYDQLFGLNGLYEHSHLWFINCNIFINSRLCPPDYDYKGSPLPGPYYFNDYIGGMEGMHQKKWTHLTACMIKYVVEQCSLNASIMCQGDNQVVIIHYTESDLPHREDKRSNFLMQLDSISHRMNMEIKKKETWYSAKLHEYGKVRIYNGASISLGTKKASKMVPDQNDNLFSIIGALSTINTMTESLARGDITPDIAHIMNGILTLNYRRRSELINSYREDRTLALVSLLFPADFGGLPCSSYQSHAVRGHDDKITTWLNTYKIIQRLNYSLFDSIMKCIYTSPAKTASYFKERTRLYEDIYSLNIKSLPSIEAELKNLSLEFLMSDAVTNPAIKKLYRGEYTISKENLIKQLDTMEPLFVQVAHSMLENSNSGILQSLQKKFTSTKTVEKLVQETTNTSFIDRIYHNNEDLRIEYRRRLFSQVKTRDYDFIKNTDCPTKIAEYLRFKSWGKKLLNLTRPPYQHQFTLKASDQISNQQREVGIAIRVSSEVINDPESCFSNYGPYKPYIGSSTHEKIRKPTMDIANKTSYTKSLQQLGTIKSWLQFVDSPNLVNLANQLIQEKLEFVDLPIDPDKLEDWCRTIISGNMLHRFITNLESRYALVNSLPSFSTHFQQSTNNMKKMTAGNKDYSIFYQIAFICNMVTISLIGQINKQSHPEYTAYLTCFDQCTEEITDVKFDLEQNPVEIVPCAMETPDCFLKTSYSYLEIKPLIEGAIGYILARGIDRNYELSHRNEANSVKLCDSQKDMISLNDLRMLDLENVLINICAYSSHCCYLIMNSNSLLPTLSGDLSFIQLAEIISNAGFLDSFFSMSSKYLSVTEHTTVTQHHKLSAFISKVIPFFIKGNKTKFSKIILSSYYINSTSTQKANIKSLLIFLFPDVFRNYTSRTHLNKFCLKLRIRESTEFKHDPLEVIAMWRAAPRPSIIPKKVKINFVKEILLASEIYHSLRLNIYKIHGIRKIEKEGFVNMKEISYIPRTLGTISSAFSKYFEILVLLSVVPTMTDVIKSIVCLAEGSGGTLNGLLEVFPKSFGCYNTLMTSNIDKRSDPTDHSPPAVLCSSKVNRLFLDNSLSIGQTNILSKNFLFKFESWSCIHRPDLVTMDAESTNHGTNWEFVENLYPVLMKQKVLVIIFKLFYYPALEEDCNNLESDEYVHLVIKPVCSNPFGREVFLVSVLKETAQKQKLFVDEVKNQSKSWLTYMKCNNFMSEETLTAIIPELANVGKMLKEIAESNCWNLVLKHKYSQFIETNKMCGMTCKRFLASVIRSSEKINENIDCPDVYLAIRDGGTNETLRRLYHDITFLIVYYLHAKRDLKTTINLLDEIQTEGNMAEVRLGKCFFLKVASSKDGNFFKTWGDAKIYFRAAAEGSYCGCDILEEESISRESFLMAFYRRNLNALKIYIGNPLIKLKLTNSNYIPLADSKK